MSSKFIVESQGSDSKKDDTLIIVVNDDGTISVDQETLQNLIMNQSDANVSVVRVGQTDGDAANGDLTLTVDPPHFERTEASTAAVTSAAAVTTDVVGLVDPFMEMDPEQLEKLETALQSEQAKQILGENVTAMLDMLTIEEQQKSIKYYIELDHCYTSRLSPTDPEPPDPLPIAHSPDISDFEYKHSGTSQQSTSLLLPSSVDANVGEGPSSSPPPPPPSPPLSSTPPPPPSPPPPPPPLSVPAPLQPAAARSNLSARNTKRAVVVRGRKTAAPQSTSGITKSTLSPRNSNVVVQQTPKKVMPGVRFEAKLENDEATSSSESSESEPPSDDDSDFGPRGPRRGGVRARGGRKGLTTRGGSMTATRRRSSNKQMDVDQVRRLDMEMAAAVDAMRSPERPERPEKFNPARLKKQTKNLSGRLKEDGSPSRTVPATEASATAAAAALSVSRESVELLEKPLQTTNQVKANLINANMIKGDMILTKPGQARDNQKVLFVRKRIMARTNEMRNNLGMKKQSELITKSGKPMPLQIQTKLGTSEDGKLVSTIETTIAHTIQDQEKKSKLSTVMSPSSPITPLSLSSSQSCSISAIRPEQRPTQVERPPCHLSSQEQSTQQCVKAAINASPPPPPNKVKTTEVKKEKKKTEMEPGTSKFEDAAKPMDMKTPVDVAKKHLKKEQRKFPAVLADTLGPALFSTPDIIRRVGSDAKGSNDGTPTTAIVHDSTDNSVALASSVQSLELPTSVDDTPVKSQGESLCSVETQILLVKIPNEDDALPSESSHELKPEAKLSTAEEPSQDPPTNAQRLKIPNSIELARSTNVPPIVPSEIVSEQSGIDGEEQLLASLDMESDKHDDELLAEALLLQEELGVDLPDHAALVDPTASITEGLLSASTFDMPIVRAPIENSESAASLVDVVTPPPVSPAAAVVAETSRKKDEKEPIQIIRGGRVITLPPIEAPATRSKRLQAKPETPQKIMEMPKKDEKIIKQLVQQQQQQHIPHQGTKQMEKIESRIDDVNAEEKEEEKKKKKKENDGENYKYNDNDDNRDDHVHKEEEEDDDDDDDEDENSDSEDDPDRLWCICKRPHNNRFMICCDVCEDWFHGKCVHVSKAMGQQMEEKGIEWVCPNCVKKKDRESNSRQKKVQLASVKTAKVESASRMISVERSSQLSSPRTSVSSSERGKTSVVISADSSHDSVPALSVTTQCVVCKKEARNSSIYCSDTCILAHAQETLTKENKPGSTAQSKFAQISSDGNKSNADARVIVFERKTGKVLTGTDAPTTSNLRTWLKENPTFEVVRPNNLNTLQIGGKTVTAIQTHGKPVKAAAHGTSSGAPTKMVYTKVMGSKQTVLAPSNKKLVVLGGGQQQRDSLSPKTILQKPQQQHSLSGKSSGMRQTTIKMVSQQVKTSTIAKKQQVPKVPSTPRGEQQQQQQQPQQQQQQQQPQQKTVQKTLPVKKAEPEPIRLNVRKTLTELLSTRIKDSQDLKLDEDAINEIALNIELELYKYFRDTGAKYKAKYRSLVFNIKDTKNLTLFRKIADRSLTPDAVVRLSPDEMASQELAEWREKETKHQLEMIKKNELDLMAQAKSIVVKTHKGELIIENEGGIDHVDPKTPVQDIVTALNSHDDGPSEENKDETNRGGNSSASEDSKRLAQVITTTLEDRNKLDGERSREKGGGGGGARRSIDKDDRVTRTKSAEDEDERRRRRKRKRRRRRSHSRSRRSKDRSRDRRSTRSKESNQERDKDSKDREREKGGNESQRRRSDKERQRRSHSGRSSRDHKSKDEETARGGGGGRRGDGERKNDVSIGETGGGGGGLEKTIEDRLWRHVEEDTANTTTATANTIFDGNDSDVSDREPSSTVNIKTPDINDEPDKDITGIVVDATATPVPAQQQQQQQVIRKQQDFVKGGPCQTVWRGFVNMVDVAKFFINAQEVSGDAKDLMEDLPDTVDVVGRISQETVWDYISKMKKTGSKEILVIRLTAANDEEKIPYITLYSYLNSRGRLGVVGNVSKNIKDFYIVPFSRQSEIPPVLLPLAGPGFEEQRPHLLLGIIVRIKRKRMSSGLSVISLPPPFKLTRKDDDSSKERIHATSRHHNHHHHHPEEEKQSSPPLDSTRPIHKGLLLESLRDEQTVTQMTLESLNKAQVGMSRATTTIVDNTSNISSKIDVSDLPNVETPRVNITDGTAGGEKIDDGDEPYSPGGGSDVDEPDNKPDDKPEIHLVKSNAVDAASLSSPSSSSVLSPSKNSTELQRKMDELNRQIEEQKQQIQSISSAFLGDTTTTLPGLGLDPPEATDMEEAYSPTDARSFTPPPPAIAKFAQPILDKVSDITIPPNLQEILANVKRQESTKIDPYLPSKPSATFLTSTNPSLYQIKSPDKYTPTFINKNNPAGRAAAAAAAESTEKPIFDITSLPTTTKETKSTLRSLSDLDLIKKAEEELAAVAAAVLPLTPIIPSQTNLQCPPRPSFSSPPPPPPPLPPPLPPLQPPLPPATIPSPAFTGIVDTTTEILSHPMANDSDKKRTGGMDQPKPPGLEDEDLPIFPTTPPSSFEPTRTMPVAQKFVPKSGIVLSVKRKVDDDGSHTLVPNKAPRTKSRWGQGPTE